MKEEKQELRCRLAGGTSIEWSVATTFDEFIQNGVYEIKVINDAGTLNLPFRFTGDDVAQLVVSDNPQRGKLQQGRSIAQTLIMAGSNGNEYKNYTRTAVFQGNNIVWSNWKQSNANEFEVLWNESSHVNLFIDQGTYNIKGERLNSNDGLPITNASPGHSISAKLMVFDSSISGNGKDSDKCITQLLVLSNRVAGDGDVYIRTGRASMKNMLAGGYGWDAWSKLQQNVEVGQVTSLDSYIDNGLYSGVYTNGTTMFETFVMVVINNYAVAAATGKERSVSQFKYALNVDRNFSYKTRTGQGTDKITWGSWVDLGAASTTDIQDGAVTADKLSADIRANAVSPLRPLFIAAGAEYNDTGADKTKTAPWGETVTHKAGHYYLNGLGDITEGQMKAIYNRGNIGDNDKAALAYSNGVANRIRTNLCRIGLWNGAVQSYFCAYNSVIESVTMHVASGTVGDTCSVAISDSDSLFFAASKLSVIDIRCLLNSAIWKDTTFKGCKQLKEVRIRQLNSNIFFTDTPLLSKTSVLFMISKSTTASAITITLHPDAYARLADDAEIIAALEAKPLISLVSA